MASGILKPSRVLAVLILAGAVAWIASGTFAPGQDPEEPATPTATETAALPLQKVTVAAVDPEEHERQITLSCTTEADESSVAVARAAGIIT